MQRINEHTTTAGLLLAEQYTASPENRREFEECWPRRR
jgi:hypothetical protein